MFYCLFSLCLAFAIQSDVRRLLTFYPRSKGSSSALTLSENLKKEIKGSLNKTLKVQKPSINIQLCFLFASPKSVQKCLIVEFLI